ncbi:MAG: alpha/beta hydrolase [Vicinamibacterales bacterium]
MPVGYSHLTRAALDRQLSPSRSAKDFAGVLRRHQRETAALDGAPGLLVSRDVAYGPRARERVDLVRPAGRAPGACLVHFHGGFWQEGDKNGSAYAARALTSRGWAVAAVGYTLAPDLRLRDIVGEAAAAVAHLAREARSLGLDAARLVLSGHSAGAHLAAAVACGVGGAEAARAVRGLVLVSGVYDLAPIAASYVNDRVGLDAGEIEALSVLARVPVREMPVHVLVGADEPEAFLCQSDVLVEAWRPRVPGLTSRRAPGRDHFDVLDELADPASPTFAAMMAMGVSGGGQA